MDRHDTSKSQFYEFGNAPKTCLIRASFAGNKKQLRYGLYSTEKNYVLASGYLQTVKTDPLMTKALTQKKKDRPN